MYRAGIYCRISIEEKKKDSEYSNSIHSQIQMAKDYIADQNEVAEVKIYADDGASGSNFERTEFRRMLADIELGSINMVILKDISRLGREHIDTNYYLGKYFPEKQVRVVSILDCYDSSAATYNELLEIKTLINDMYLRDISKKIRAAIQTKRGMGEYTLKEPPFGYVKSKTICNHLEVDEYAAKIVGRIYKMYLSGFGCTAICRALNEDHIPSPAKYKKEILNSGYAWKTGKGLWTPAAVGGILKNPVYMGAIVLKKYEKPSYKLGYRKTIPLEELELIPDSHEAIISKEDFEQAQKIRKEHQVSYFDKNKNPHKYAGLLFCGKCKTAMRKRYLASQKGYDGYMCGFHQKMGQNYCELNHITFEKLDELVAFAINQQLKRMRSDLKNMESDMPQEKVRTDKKMQIDKKAAGLEKRIERNTEYRKRAYEKFADDVCSKEEYLELIQIYDNENRQYQKELQELKKTEQEQIATARKEEKWLGNFIRGKLTAKQLPGDFLAEFIDRIYVYPNQKIDIYFKFAAENGSTKK